MKRLKNAVPRPLPLLVLCCLALAPATTRPAWVTPEQFHFKQLLGNPPPDNSPEHKAEIDQMLDLQAARTPEQVKRCRDEIDLTPFAFATVLGDWFNEQNLPVTGKLLNDANVNAKTITDVAKRMFARVRPPLAEPRIKPCVPLEHTASYPSGHAVRGMLWASILAEMFPDKRQALLARGKQIGDDRFLAGMHYPSDVVAGQKLGADIAKRLLNNDDFLARLEKAKQECLAKAPAKSG